jgi:hypothetical protein
LDNCYPLLGASLHQCKNIPQKVAMEIKALSPKHVKKMKSSIISKPKLFRIKIIMFGLDFFLQNNDACLILHAFL